MDNKKWELIGKHFKAHRLDVSQEADKPFGGKVSSSSNDNDSLVIYVRGKKTEFNCRTYEYKMHGKFKPKDLAKVCHALEGLTKVLVDYDIQKHKEQHLARLARIKQNIGIIGIDFNLDENMKFRFNEFIDKLECRVNQVCPYTRKPLEENK